MLRYLSAGAICGATSLGAFTGTAVAQENTPKLPYACVLKTSSEFIHLVHCPLKIEDAELAEVGKAACREALPCGVWFWHDATRIPEEAPENHDGLTQEQITTALGVWDEEGQNLMRITVE